MNLPRTQDEIFAALREIASARPSSKSELRDLVSRSVALSRHIAAHGNLADQVPELVWHFLSDADIRFKDSHYADLQLSQMSALLSSGDSNDAQ